MSSTWIRKRSANDGPRYLVAYRIGGRGGTDRHAGSFRTLKEARARQEFIRLELASGRDPKVSLAALVRKRWKLNEVSPAWFATRVDLEQSSLDTYQAGWRRLEPEVGTVDPHEVTPERVQEIVNQLVADGLSPKTIHLYVKVVLGGLLDYADVEPNPVRSRKVKLPRIQRKIPHVPTRSHIDAVLRLVKPKLVDPIILMEQTGMRVGEVCGPKGVEWQDIDERACKIRIREGKTPAARRLVDVPEWVMARIAERCPRDDRVAERKVFQSVTPGMIDAALRKACVAAGVPVFSAHKLRHRYASVMAKRGVPRTDLAAQIGHARISELDVYEHVILDEVIS